MKNSLQQACIVGIEETAYTRGLGRIGGNIVHRLQCGGHVERPRGGCPRGGCPRGG